MCFSETQSFINTIILIIGSIYVYPKYRLSIMLIFLALKDLIQGLSYRNIKRNKSTQLLTSLSWIHICFQPLFVNIFMSNFSQNKNNYWNIIFIICFLYGIYTLTTLNEFDIQNDPDCITKNTKDDFCSKYTMSYIGKYHLGYKFNRDKGWFIFPKIYLILMVIPSLFTNSRILGIIWILFIGMINISYNKINNTKFQENEGEKAAIWCFLSIVFFLPIAVFNKQISKFLF
jgi:hypothetical protein